MPRLCSLSAGATRRLEMRVIDCNECGETLKAANDEELAESLSNHMSSEHSEVECNAEQATELVERRAYSATDS
jgi:predicted small metal-binding protein